MVHLGNELDLDSNERIVGSLGWLVQLSRCGWWGFPFPHLDVPAHTKER